MKYPVSGDSWSILSVVIHEVSCQWWSMKYPVSGDSWSIPLMLIHEVYRMWYFVKYPVNADPWRILALLIHEVSCQCWLIKYPVSGDSWSIHIWWIMKHTHLVNHERSFSIICKLSNYTSDLRFMFVKLCINCSNTL